MVRDFLAPNSIQSGAVIVAVISALLALVWVRFRLGIVVWVFALGAPYVVSYSLYWLPAWIGQNADEYGSWAPMFLIPWYLSGVIGSLAVVLLIRRD